MCRSERFLIDLIMKAESCEDRPERIANWEEGAMNINVSPEVEQQLVALAAQVGKDAADLGGSLLEEKMRESGFLSDNNGTEVEDPEALARAVAAMTNRTPEEIEAARARLFAQSRPPRPLPEGKTLLDVISGQWPGDETDEEVFEALRKLS